MAIKIFPPIRKSNYIHLGTIVPSSMLLTQSAQFHDILARFDHTICKETKLKNSDELVSVQHLMRLMLKSPKRIIVLFSDEIQ